MTRDDPPHSASGPVGDASGERAGDAVLAAIAHRLRARSERQQLLTERLRSGELRPGALADLAELAGAARRGVRDGDHILVLAGVPRAEAPVTAPTALGQVLNTVVAASETASRTVVPPTPSVSLATAAEPVLGQILAELLAHAAGATPPGERLELHTRWAPDGGIVVELQCATPPEHRTPVDELDRELNSATPSGPVAPQEIGLHVAARLARAIDARLGVRGSAGNTGVSPIAVLALPPSVLGGGHAPDQPAVPAQEQGAPPNVHPGQGEVPAAGQVPAPTAQPVSGPTAILAPGSTPVPADADAPWPPRPSDGRESDDRSAPSWPPSVPDPAASAYTSGGHPRPPAASAYTSGGLPRPSAAPDPAASAYTSGGQPRPPGNGNGVDGTLSIGAAPPSDPGVASEPAADQRPATGPQGIGADQAAGWNPGSVVPDSGSPASGGQPGPGPSGPGLPGQLHPAGPNGHGLQLPRARPMPGPPPGQPSPGGPAGPPTPGPQGPGQPPPGFQGPGQPPPGFQGPGQPPPGFQGPGQPPPGPQGPGPDRNWQPYPGAPPQQQGGWPQAEPTPVTEALPVLGAAGYNPAVELFGPFDTAVPVPVDDSDDPPIFAAVASAWFREPASPDASAQPANGNPGNWRTAGDAEFEAARIRADRVVDLPVTERGLPQRLPGQAMVPPSWRDTPNGAQSGASRERQPDRVRNRLASYQRGLREGRHRAAEEQLPQSANGAPVNGHALNGHSGRQFRE